MERGYNMTAKTNKHYNITDLKDSITDLENQYAEHYMHDEKGMEMAIQSAINCCKKFSFFNLYFLLDFSILYSQYL